MSTLEDIEKAIGFSDDTLLDYAGIAQAKQGGKWAQLTDAILNGTGSVNFGAECELWGRAFHFDIS